MSHVTYRVVQHDEGWAYTVDGVFSAVPHARRGARGRPTSSGRAARSRPTEAIEYEDANGKWHTETARGSDRPDTDVKG